MIPQLSALLLTGALAAVTHPTDPPVKRADPKAVSCTPEAFISSIHTRYSHIGLVFAHVIVGNTYNYTPNQWALDITLAASKAIDAFTMNVGRDDWQPTQVLDAYNTAQKIAPNFKLSVLLHMNLLACAMEADGQYIIDKFITLFKSHPNQYLYNNKMFLSTFAGQSCTFSQASAPAGWQWLIQNTGTLIYFILNLQIGDATQLSTTWNFIDGFNK
ncbi:hypothetical protein FRC11_009759 [Ceratobasidium sp. 423]|nr:hypothetical protein FRC11_009759 [Ceratobasidium sp. 423]